MSLTIDRNGWFVADQRGPRVFHAPTVRTTPLETRAPLAIVWHTTGSTCGRNFAEGLVRRLRTYRRGVDRPASFHLLIARNGTVFQCAPTSVGTWHVGRPGEVSGRTFPNINRATLGIELENAGPLRAIRDGFYTWPFFLEPHAPEKERRPDPRYQVARPRASLFSDGRFYDLFPPAQVASAGEVLRACRERYRFSRQASAYAHSDFAAPTKTDPGPLWMRGILPRLLDQVFGGTSSPATKEVTA